RSSRPRSADGRTLRSTATTRPTPTRCGRWDWTTSATPSPTCPRRTARPWPRSPGPRCRVTDELDRLADALATGTAPALIGAVRTRDAEAVRVLLGHLDVLRLRALAVVLADLAGALDEEAALPDEGEQPEAEARLEDYLWPRSQGVPVAEAAARVGVAAEHGRTQDERPHRKEAGGVASWTRGCGRWRPNAPAPGPASTGSTSPKCSTPSSKTKKRTEIERADVPGKVAPR